MSMPAKAHRTLPVDEDTIRLLHLQAANTPEADIKCTLAIATLSQGLRYEAVSYSWGTPSTKRTIYIEGQQVRVRENLYDCLLRARSSLEVRVLWIDAICVNQADLREKGHQIHLMPKIFTNAERVLVWVGEAAHDSDQFFYMSIDSVQYPLHLSGHPHSSSTPKSNSFGGLIGTGHGLFRSSSWQRS